jgi:hypothetical protein
LRLKSTRTALRSDLFDGVATEQRRKPLLSPATDT